MNCPGRMFADCRRVRAYNTHMLAYVLYTHASTCIILDLLEDQNLKFRLAEKSTEDAVNVVKNAFQTNSCAVV